MTTHITIIIGIDEDQGSSTNIRTDKILIEKTRRYVESGMKVNQIYHKLDKRLTRGTVYILEQYSLC